MQILLLLILAACLWGATDHAEALQPAPDRKVLDPGDVWNPEDESRLTALSDFIFKERRFRVYFVAIGAGDMDSPETVAEEFSNAWLQGAPGAVFITLLNRPALGVSVGEGKQSRPSADRITDTRLYLWEHRADGSTATTLSDAARNLVRDLKVFSAPAKGDPASDSESEGLRLNWPLIGAIAGGIFVLGLLIYLFRLAKQSNFFGHQFEFPVPQVRGRFGGINSGGHGVMIDFKSANSTKSQKAQDY